MYILNGFLVTLVVAGALTANEPIRLETIALASIGFLMLGAAARQRIKR